MPIKASTTTHEFSLIELEKMFAEQLDVPQTKITVEYVLTTMGDERWSTTYQKVTSVKVTVRGE